MYTFLGMSIVFHTGASSQRYELSDFAGATIYTCIVVPFCDVITFCVATMHAIVDTCDLH